MSTISPNPPLYDPEELDAIFEKEFELEEAEAAESNNEKKDAPKYEKQELASLRAKLFEKGSTFQETHKEEIIGINNVLVEIDEVIKWLCNSTEFLKHGARLEPGIIFEGHPGTGKTLVSRYIATESDALFVNIRDFAHNGPLFKDSDIRDLFRRARATYARTKRPIVLFWDEFENGAAERSNASAEQAATVSQLTAELDGVHGKNEGVLLIGCTNYIYGIDRALRRPGRMGLQIEFCAPDRKGKKLLLDHYIKRYPRGRRKIDVETLSYFLSEQDTAAAIEEACMEAWRVAVAKVIGTRSKPQLTQEDLIDVLLKRLVGPPTAFIDLPMEDRYRVAVHETGHAIMALVFGIPLRLITVQPGKKSLGKVITAGVKEHIGTFDEMISDMRVLVGSIIAERKAGLPQSIGATSDIDKVNKLATNLVDDLHGGDLTGLYRARSVGKERFGGHEGGANPTVSDQFVERSDLDVQAQLKKVESDGERVMSKIGEELISEIAQEVNERVTMTGIEFTDLFIEITGFQPDYYRPSDCLIAA